MGSLIDDQQKQVIKNIVDMIHDTFAREIIVYKQGRKISFITSGGYNALYKKNPSIPQVELEQNSRVIKARIKYQSFDQTNFYQESSQEKIVIPEGVVYIKVDKDGYDYVKDAKTVELDGITYAIKSPGKPEGIFGPHYYKFLLIPLEN